MFRKFNINPFYKWTILLVESQRGPAQGARKVRIRAARGLCCRRSYFHRWKINKNKTCRLQAFLPPGSGSETLVGSGTFAWIRIRNSKNSKVDQDLELWNKSFRIRNTAKFIGFNSCVIYSRYHLFSGEGQGREKDAKITIYKKTEDTYMLKLKTSREFYSKVSSNSREFSPRVSDPSSGIFIGPVTG